MKFLTETQKASLATFSLAPDDAGSSIPVTQTLLGGRARASIYRDIAAGRLNAFTVGKTRLIRNGSIRQCLKSANAA